jgi:hypothetical protein
VSFAPGVVAQFYIDEVKVRSTVDSASANGTDPPRVQYDASKPGIIGAPLRMGSPPNCQEYDELAEVMNFPFDI